MDSRADYCRPELSMGVPFLKFPRILKSMMLEFAGFRGPFKPLKITSRGFFILERPCAHACRTEEACLHGS